MKLWDRIRRGMEAGFEAASASVHNITEKAGESIELTRLRREKVRKETKVTRMLAELGNEVFERISSEQLDDVAKRLGIAQRVVEVAQSEAELVEIDRRLGRELEHGETKQAA